MKKMLILCMLVFCLFIFGCGSIGNAISSTQQVCCCRVTPLPREGMQYHVFQHFSMCIPPDYEVAINMDASPSVNKDPEMCEQFCATMFSLGSHFG